MGYLHKGVCYPAQLDARVAACSDYPVTWGDGVNVHSLQCSSAIDFSASLMSMTRTTNGSVETSVLQPWPTQPDCNFSGASDLAYDWFLAAMAVLVIVWGGKHLIRLFEQHHSTD